MGEILRTFSSERRVRLAMEEKTQDDGHIITTKAAHLTVRSQTAGHQFFTDLTETRNE